jgi:hypothetical protein
MQLTGSAWGEAPLVPYAAATGPGTPGRHSTAASNYHPHPPALQLRALTELNSHAGPGSPRSSSLGPPGQYASSRGPPPSMLQNYTGRSTSPSAPFSPRQQHVVNSLPLAQANYQPSTVGIGRLQLGPGAPSGSMGHRPEISEEFREAMGGCTSSWARRRPCGVA